MADPIHLDHNATTRPLPEVVEAVRRAMAEEWGNPSSIHRGGMSARHAVDLARESLADLLGASPRQVVFTSGGTESANLAIFGTLAHFEGGPRRVLATSRLEHSCVREAAEAFERRGGEVLWVPHRPDGTVEPAALEEILRQRGPEIALVSLMAANNETGVLAPIGEVGAICRDAGVRFHTDAVQWAGRLELDFRSLPIDLLTCSAHKFHGPKGVGALLVRGGVRLSPQLVGGPQERQRRGGTENVPAIVGAGVAAEAAKAWLAGGSAAGIELLRDRFEREVLARCSGAEVHGASAGRLWNTSNIGFPRLEAEAILMVLSERGVHASAGAACSSGSLDPSPVLLAMGVPPTLAHGSVRFSLGRETSASEIDRAVSEIAAAVTRLARSLP